MDRRQVGVHLVEHARQDPEKPKDGRAFRRINGGYAETRSDWAPIARSSARMLPKQGRMADRVFFRVRRSGRSAMTSPRHPRHAPTAKLPANPRLHLPHGTHAAPRVCAHAKRATTPRTSPLAYAYMCRGWRGVSGIGAYKPILPWGRGVGAVGTMKRRPLHG